MRLRAGSAIGELFGKAAPPDEGKVQAYMTAKRTQLGPACGKVFDTADKL